MKNHSLAFTEKSIKGNKSFIFGNPLNTSKASKSNLNIIKLNLNNISLEKKIQNK